MKSLLLALLLAAPLRAADTTGPVGPRGGVPAAGAGVSVPSVPNLAPGVTGTGLGAVPSAGVPGVSVPGALPAGISAPKATLSGPEAAGPQGAPEAGKPSAAAQPSGEQAAPKAAGESARVDSAAAGDGKASAPTAASAGASKSGSEADVDGGVLVPVSAESQKSGADQKFDGTATRQDAAPSVAAPKGFAGKLAARLGLSRFTGAKAELPKTAFDRDSFGGPQKLELTKAGKVKYGLRWGLSLTGIATLLQLSLGTLFAFFPWQLHVSHGLLTGAGRVELLTGAGPAALGAAIMSHPVSFFLLQLPMMTFKEELAFRVVQFGMTFLLLSAIRPAAGFVSGFIKKMPDVVGVKWLQRGLDLASKVSSKAFTIAAVLSAWHFATAHFAAWGISPESIAVHSVLGFSLAYVAYKTRSLATAFVAHLSYNVLSLGAVALAVTLSPLVGMAYGLGLSVVSVAGLYLHWRSYRKAKKLAGAQAKLSLRNGVSMILLAALMGGSLLAGGARSAMSDDVRQAVKAQAEWTLPGLTQAQAVPPQQAGPDQKTPDDSLPPEAKQLMDQLAKQLGMDQGAPQKLEGLAAITAQSKPSVVEVIDPGVGLGSGYIVSADGLVLTNGHVVGDATEVIVKLENGAQGKAKVVAVNHDKDIAIVQLPARKDGWPALKIATGELHEGDEVLAMGHPLGLPFTVTRGIVSGIGQHRGNLYVDHIQTDAAINHGNSGGPLISAKTGEIVGMNTEIASTVDANIGLGFSISAKDLRAAIDQYRATGNINGSWAGFIINASVEPSYTQGIEVEQVRPGSPAAKAGLQPGDRILGANGTMFGEPQAALHELALTIARTKPGTEIVIAVGREGEVALVKLKLADKKS